MTNVFFNDLKMRWTLLQTAKNRRKYKGDIPPLSVILKDLKCDCLFTVMFPPYANESQIEELKSEYCFNYHLRIWLKWVCDRIIYDENVINPPHYNTRLVRIRIATSKLNKLVDEKKLEKNKALLIHDGLTKNVWYISSSLLDEDIPFLNWIL